MQAPNANAHAEHRIRTLQADYLDLSIWILGTYRLAARLSHEATAGRSSCHNGCTRNDSDARLSVKVSKSPQRRRLRVVPF